MRAIKVDVCTLKAKRCASSRCVQMRAIKVDVCKLTVKTCASKVCADAVDQGRRVQARCVRTRVIKVKTCARKVCADAVDQGV